MVKRTSFEHDDCPVARALDAIGDWWSMLIIRDALFGVSRFSEFHKRLGLAKNILTVRLRALVDEAVRNGIAPRAVIAYVALKLDTADGGSRWYLARMGSPFTPRAGLR